MPSDRHAGYELITAVTALELKVLDTQVEHFMENTSVEITMEEDPEILSSCALGLMFTLGVLSFHDARPRGVSEMHYQEDDEFTVADFLSHLRYDQGRLHLYVDYLRGRMLKTDVYVHPDGKIVLRTVNRGESATRWVDRLLGKKLMTLVGDTEAPTPDNDGKSEPPTDPETSAS